MEIINCNLCENNNTTFLFSAKDRATHKGFFNIVMCNKCGLIFLNPRPSEEEIKDFYPPNYHSRPTTFRSNFENANIWNIPWNKAMEIKSIPILKYFKSGKILDIGCGDGSLLKYLKNQGWDTYGVEIQESASQYAAQILDLNIFNGRIEDTNFSADFDVITLFHVLEHLHNPIRTLKIAYSLLKDNGILIIEVPNFASFESKLFKSSWVGIAAPLHLFHFTPLSIRKLLEKVGFKVIALEFVPERTKYIANYSESVRFFLTDYGLYNSANNSLNEQLLENTSNISSIKSFLKYIEYLFFRNFEYITCKLRMGPYLQVTCRKQ